MPETHSEINISRVRRAIDFWDGFTGGERLVAGVIADHFNSEEGYAFPTYRYLEFVYGFSQTTISNAVEKLRKGLMTVDNSGGNNRYKPDPQKVESVLVRLKEKREEWKRKKSEDRKAKKVLHEMEQDAPRDGAAALHEAEPNVQRNAQPKDQHIPDEASSGVSARSSERERACGAGQPGNEKQANQYRQTREEAKRDWIELNRIISGTSEDAEHQPGKRSDRGAMFLWFKLLRSGVPSSQIVQAAESYRDRQRSNGQWVAGVAGFLAKFDQEMREDGTYPETERHAANDNQHFRAASGDDDLNRGVEVDV
ncbi:hypothetical protein [Bradyrhizobium sp. CCGB01]|uniref:hypothetical protein n=1 Tax=Bradyrhizobium sp. CCGB01 TaxID=2949634 RepID=UPI0020B31DEB|nr:hypothetical protein [Bradyrhizobium sp. CCGB01]MCP3412038.1 hypothetical protein [Bradyrhizobium sp. CCGB01]